MGDMGSHNNWTEASQGDGWHYYHYYHYTNYIIITTTTSQHQSSCATC
jgi:hypothetical protein